MGFCGRHLFRVIQRCSAEIINPTATKSIQREYVRNYSLYRNSSLCYESITDSVINSLSKRQLSTGNLSMARRSIIMTRLDAEILIRKMGEKELELLTRSLRDLEQEKNLEKKEPVAIPPTTRQLLLLFLQNGIPFVGFGFLDNAIMIIAGDYIDSTIGVTLGISTMAAAAIGNLVSDCCGIGLAGYVEIAANRLGIHPHLRSSQLRMKITKRTEYLGRGVGIIIGCLIGMMPLMFLHPEDKNDSKVEESKPVDNSRAVF